MPTLFQTTDHLFEQAFALWVTPEVERRRAAGLLKDDWHLTAAQIVFNVGGTNDVRLNEQVRAELQLRATRPMEKGEAIRTSDFSEIVGMRLTAPDENAGHVSMFLHQGKWYVFFDFRYNARRVRDNVEAADEFLASAASNLEAGHLRATLDGLHIAAERLAKGYLLLLPDERLLDTKNHGLVLDGFNRFTHLGNAPNEYADVLKRLRNESASARYSITPLKYGPAQLHEMLATVEAMRKDLETRIPREPAAKYPDATRPSERVASLEAT